MRLVNLHNVLPENLRFMINEFVKDYVKGESYEIFLGQVRVGGYGKSTPAIVDNDRVVEEILATVTDYFTVLKRDIFPEVRNRKHPYAEYRQIIFYLTRKYTDLNFKEIGAIFGNHHSMIVYSVKTITGRLEIDKHLRYTMSKLEANLNSF